MAAVLDFSATEVWVLECGQKLGWQSQAGFRNRLLFSHLFMLVLMFGVNTSSTMSSTKGFDVNVC